MAARDNRHYPDTRRCRRQQLPVLWRSRLSWELEMKLLLSVQFCVGRPPQTTLDHCCEFSRETWRRSPGRRVLSFEPLARKRGPGGHPHVSSQRLGTRRLFGLETEATSSFRLDSLAPGSSTSGPAELSILNL